MSLEALTILSLRSWCSSSSSRKLSNMGVYSLRTRGALGPLLLALPLKSLFWPGIFDRVLGMGILSPCFWSLSDMVVAFGRSKGCHCWVRTSCHQVQGSTNNPPLPNWEGGVAYPADPAFSTSTSLSLSTRPFSLTMEGDARLLDKEQQLAQRNATLLTHT